MRVAVSTGIFANRYYYKSTHQLAIDGLETGHGYGTSVKKAYAMNY